MPEPIDGTPELSGTPDATRPDLPVLPHELLWASPRCGGPQWTEAGPRRARPSETPSGSGLDFTDMFCGADPDSHPVPFAANHWALTMQAPQASASNPRELSPQVRDAIRRGAEKFVHQLGDADRIRSRQFPPDYLHQPPMWVAPHRLMPEALAGLDELHFRMMYPDDRPTRRLLANLELPEHTPIIVDNVTEERPRAVEGDAQDER